MSIPHLTPRPSWKQEGKGGSRKAGVKGEESPPAQPLVLIRLGSWSLLEEPHGGKAGSQSLLEETL